MAIKNKKFKKPLKITLITFLILSIVGIIFVSSLFYYYSRDLPTLEALKNYEPRLISKIYDAEDSVIAQFSKEKRTPVNLDEISQNVFDAFIAAEDADFYSHRGINPLTILRAAFINLKAGRTAQGGSTITQQVVKSILLTPEKTFTRKIKEVILSIKLESALSKNEILNLYLNHIFLGAGAYGVEAASQIYFGKSALELSVPEAAILAGLPQAPSRDNPKSHPKNSKKRQYYVLRRLLETGVLTKEMFEEYVSTPIKILRSNSLSRKKSSPYFVEHVRRYLKKKYGEKSLYEDGLNVYTTLNSKWDQGGQKAIDKGLETVDKRAGLRPPQKNLSSKESIDIFLEDQQRKLVKKYYNYRILTADGSLEDPQLPNDPVLLSENSKYQAVVVDKRSKDKAIVIRIGSYEGFITRDKYKWAQEANVAEIYKTPKMRYPYKSLKKGDVITVSTPKKINIKKLNVALDQHPLVQGALLSYSLPEGKIVSMIGGYNFEQTNSHFNRATQAKRQSGSVFKPFIYAAALEEGLTPSTVIVDSPLVYQNSQQQNEFEKTWRPNNYGHRFYGDTLLRDALAYSRNIPTIKLLQHLGIKKTINFLKKIGIKSKLNEDLSLALGSSSLTLEELLSSWSIFANHGKKVSPYFIRKILDRKGQTLEQHAELPKEQVISEGNAFLITSMLKSVVEYGTAASALKGFKREAAGKTGTTNDFKDALFLGYIPQVITGVWVGFDSSIQIGPNEPGGRAAAPIWLSYNKTVVENLSKKKFDIPKSVIQLTVDSETGDLPSARTTKTRREFFVDGKAPGQIVKNKSVASTAAALMNQTRTITGYLSKKSDSSHRHQYEDRLETDELMREQF